MSHRGAARKTSNTQWDKSLEHAELRHGSRRKANKSTWNWIAGSHSPGSTFPNPNTDIHCYWVILLNNNRGGTIWNNICVVMTKETMDLSDPRVNYNPQIHIRGLLIQTTLGQRAYRGDLSAGRLDLILSLASRLPFLSFQGRSAVGRFRAF